MHHIIIFVTLLLISLTSLNTRAGELRQLKNALSENISILVKENPQYINLQTVRYKNLDIALRDIKKLNKGFNDSKHQEFVSSNYIEEFIFNKIGIEPDFCDDFKNIGDENIDKCRTYLNQLVSHLNKEENKNNHMLYLANNSASEFKKLFIISHDNAQKDFIVLQLSIANE